MESKILNIVDGAASVKEIRIGQSGAGVYEINGTQILKHVVRQNLKNVQFTTYTKEALFYQFMKDKGKSYIPEISKLSVSEDEIIICMKKYNVLNREDINEKLLGKIASILAQIHSESVPDFIDKSKAEIEVLSEEQIGQCFEGWKSVLEEHPGAFNLGPLEEIKNKINEIISWQNTEERLLSHGDFHWENLLEGSDGNLIVCDWQGVNYGPPSSDLSFFFSRLSADGIKVDQTSFLNKYAQSIRELSGKTINIVELLRHMAAANVITSFCFWHQYLHGNGKERVDGIYSKMLEDFCVTAMKNS